MKCLDWDTWLLISLTLKVVIFLFFFLSTLGTDGVVLTCSKGHLIALDIIRGLVFLHSNKVVHADLKAKNVLLTQNAGEPHLLQLDIQTQAAFASGT